jgi:hypothetical protein
MAHAGGQLVPNRVVSPSVELIAKAMREDDNRSPIPPSDSSLGSVSPMTDASFDMAGTSSCGSDHSPAEHQTFYIREDMVKIQVRSIQLCDNVYEPDNSLCRSKTPCSDSRFTCLSATRRTLQHSSKTTISAKHFIFRTRMFHPLPLFIF